MVLLWAPGSACGVLPKLQDELPKPSGSLGTTTDPQGAKLAAQKFRIMPPQTT